MSIWTRPGEGRNVFMKKSVFWAAKRTKTVFIQYKTMKALNDTSPTPVPKYFQRTMTKKR